MAKKSAISYLILLAGIVILGLVSFTAYKESKRSAEIQKEIDNLAEEAETIRKNNSELQEKISYFETDEFKEKIAKEKLNLQKEGENVVIIKSSPIVKGEDYNGEKEEEVEKVVQIPNYRKWWNYFFKY